MHEPKSVYIFGLYAPYFNQLQLSYLVHERKDYTWDNLILTVDNVLCHCPQHWTDLDVWEDAKTLRFCEEKHHINIVLIIPRSTIIVSMSLLETLHGGAKSGNEVVTESVSAERCCHLRSHKTFHL